MLSSRPRLLDLFCGAGGAAAGYARAGFEVVGVDIAPQSRFPFAFREDDALDYLRWVVTHGTTVYDAIHASPPCQFATAYRRAGNVKDSPNLIGPTRDLLERTGLPFVIENVEQAAPWLRNPVVICGSMFDPVMDIRRHRLFEANWSLEPPIWPCRHKLQAPGRFKPSSNRTRGRSTIEIGAWNESLDSQRAAMGVDWMNLEELSEAIPPAYTEHIGAQLIALIR